MKSCSPWTLLLSVILVVVIRTTLVESYCSNTQFKCGNNRCIPMPWTCDDDDDCGDNSDEKNCEVKACGSDEFKCSNGTKCIPSRWKCDGDVDCEDGSDESSATCDNLQCTDEQFSCGTNQPCIPKEWKCDQQPDCKNGADEVDCEAATCEADQFKCSNGHCISMKWLCDQDDDCGDQSDETPATAQCGAPTCAEGEFKCVNSSRCLPAHWVCDGDRDCNDDSDETGPGCESVNKCRDNEFLCETSRLCIHKSWKCDGDFDCVDHSDEKNCSATTCRPGEFQCANSQCIPGILQCNEEEDCSDGSDEIDCQVVSVQTCNPSTEFDCYGDGSSCIPLSGVCNGHQDCSNNADEEAHTCALKNKCQQDNGGCFQKCLFDRNVQRCECYPGYELDADQKSCNDIDECSKHAGLCSQTCTNIKGHYKCSCLDGYSPDPNDSHGCRINENTARATIVFANREDLREVDMRTHTYSTVVGQTRSAVALDFDIRKNLVFWSDVAEEKLFWASKLGGETTEVDVQVSMPDGIAYDWIHGNLYWTDTGLDIIGAINLESQHKRKLLDHSHGLDEPRSIVLDPIHGWMYWSDWGTPARIHKAGMDGSHMSVIVSTDIVWPNGITIDYASNRLYWVDAKLHTIASSDLNGLNRYNVLTSMTALHHPFAITVFEDYVYWTDWELQSIQKVIKMNPFPNSNRSLDIVPVLEDLYSPMDLHIYHHQRQPLGVNHCQDACGPNQFCLPAPYFNAHSPKVNCLCSDGQEGCNDGTARTPSTPNNRTTTTSKNSVIKGLPTKKPAVTEKPTVTEKPNVVTYDPEVTGTTVESAVTPAPQDQGVGTIAAIVSGAVAGVLIIAVIVGILVYRYYTRRNVKSMNFDNPVYRKTTEDQFSLEKNQYQPANRLAMHNSPNAQFQPLTQEDSDLVV